MGELTGWLAEPVTRGNGMPRVVPPFAGFGIWAGMKKIGRWAIIFSVGFATATYFSGPSSTKAVSAPHSESRHGRLTYQWSGPCVRPGDNVDSSSARKETTHLW
jgi:hypothetical protein